jgi:ABC-2 type transport system ATP-binding protein
MSAPAETAALDIRGLTKAYRVGHIRRTLKPVLVDLTLSVPPGEVFGYLGPNGSGKTTTLKVLTGLVFPDAGSATLLGAPIGDRAGRQRIGFLPENPNFYDYLTPHEYLDYAGRLFGMGKAERRDRARELLEKVGLTAFADVPLRRFSKGMLQRMGIAQALVNSPDLVFLDEPMSGLDPIGRRLVRELILDLKAAGKTVFFSTHILSDAETLCDRVALLRGGRLVAVGRLADILHIDFTHMEILVTGIPESALDALPPGSEKRRTMGERWTLHVPESQLGTVVQALQAAGGRILSVQPVRQSLEEYFFKEMGAPTQWDLAD